MLRLFLLSLMATLAASALDPEVPFDGTGYHELGPTEPVVAVPPTEKTQVKKTVPKPAPAQQTQTLPAEVAVDETAFNDEAAFNSEAAFNGDEGAAEGGSNLLIIVIGLALGLIALVAVFVMMQKKKKGDPAMFSRPEAESKIEPCPETITQQAAAPAAPAPAAKPLPSHIFAPGQSLPTPSSPPAARPALPPASPKLPPATTVLKPSPTPATQVSPKEPHAYADTLRDDINKSTELDKRGRNVSGLIVDEDKYFAGGKANFQDEDRD